MQQFILKMHLIILEKFTHNIQQLRFLVGQGICSEKLFYALQRNIEATIALLLLKMSPAMFSLNLQSLCVHKVSVVQHFTSAHLYVEQRV